MRDSVTVTLRHLPRDPEDAFAEGSPLHGFEPSMTEIRDMDWSMCRRLIALGKAVDTHSVDDDNLPYVYGYKGDGLLAFVPAELTPHGRYATED